MLFDFTTLFKYYNAIIPLLSIDLYGQNSEEW